MWKKCFQVDSQEVAVFLGFGRRFQQLTYALYVVSLYVLVFLTLVRRDYFVSTNMKNMADNEKAINTLRNPVTWTWSAYQDELSSHEEDSLL